jgi:DNA-binding IclR family transcriptional regulator
VERAIELLFRLAAHRQGVGLQQLAREIGCSKSTVHRLLATLQGVQVVEQDATSRQYRLGARAGQLAGNEPQAADVRRLALPLMQQLRDETGETVTLHILENCCHVVVEQCESRQEIRRILPLNQPVPLLTGATAKVMLAFLAPERAEGVLGQTRTATESGPTAQELRGIAAKGHTFSLGERVAGGAALSAPIIDGQGQLRAALSVSGPSFRFTAAQANRSVPALLQATARVCAALGMLAK